ncbi:MAG: N-acetylmuramic acid 6-phosphate etherase [Alphaproteobacteria bacterium]|nr:N-acetylmuramic acid 6-phosphate etherase [Alphaproteobacteria bacterium]
MDTETSASEFDDLDLRPTVDAVRALWLGQQGSVLAVEKALPSIARAADAAAARLATAGRLIYAGAGTPARIAVQDGVELFPTFGWPRERMAFAIAGGNEALDASIEGAEDDAAAGAAIVEGLNVTTEDVVIAVSASGSTPFTLASLQAARSRGALDIAIANNAGSLLLRDSFHPIIVETGREVIAGSTRMNAGTAQKVVLNLLSTAIMIRLGRVYGGLMIGMRPSNVKLRRRAIGIVARISGCGVEAAERALTASSGDIAEATLVASGIGPERARATLLSTGGNLRVARSRLGLEET